MTWTTADVAAHFARMGVANPVQAACGEKPTTVQPPKARMNKWEEAYIREELEPLRLAGDILWYGFEAMTLRLAGRTTYTPDFAVLTKFGLDFREVKGFWREDALIKFKVAAEHFPFIFMAISKVKVSDGGGWKVIRYINNTSEITKGVRP